MAAIGNFGKYITFEVSDKKALPIQSMKRTVSGRWKKHNLLKKQPKMEYLGPDSGETTITVILNAERGIKPRATIDKLESACKTGQVEYLVIGGKAIGGSKMCIESMTEEWDCIWNKGELVKAKVNLTFVEAP